MVSLRMSWHQPVVCLVLHRRGGIRKPPGHARSNSEMPPRAGEHPLRPWDELYFHIPLCSTYLLYDCSTASKACLCSILWIRWVRSRSLVIMARTELGVVCSSSKWPPARVFVVTRPTTCQDELKWQRMAKWGGIVWVVISNRWNKHEHYCPQLWLYIVYRSKQCYHCPV